MVDSTKVVMWTYDNSAADIGMHLLWLLLTKSRLFQWCKQNTAFRPIITGINILRYVVIKNVNESVGIKSTAGVKTFVQ